MVEERRLTKNEKRRAREKLQAADVKKNGNGNGTTQPSKHGSVEKSEALKLNGLGKENIAIDIQYVSADYETDDTIDPSILEQFKDVFSKFSKAEELTDESTPSEEVKESEGNIDSKGKGREGKEGGGEDEEEEGAGKISNKKKKLLTRLSVAALKQAATKPEIVEAHDVTATDPKFLVHLKSTRNTVPVPRHWCQVRKYLQGKRGVEKVPFQLPEFIAETGIAKIRDAVLEQEAMKKGKQKARDRVKPKMGKIDIDYQVLHDAFFKYQTKPKLSGHGDLYYEGKEFELNMKEKKPGSISDELQLALGMTEGLQPQPCPPPWLINMQRYGMPPSYPSLRIPGLNAPLPQGAIFGYQPGGWGKPPVDEYGRPLYGDVFGTIEANEQEEVIIDKTYRWGVIEIEEEELEEEEEEEAGEGEGEGEGEGREGGRFDHSGTDTPATLAETISSGLETPDIIDLRKRAGQETPDTYVPKELYTVMQERQTSGGSAQVGQMFGSDRTYVMPGKGDVQISIHPDELEEVMKDKDKLRDKHDALASVGDYGGSGSGKGTGRNGTDTEDSKAMKKRKMESSGPMKRLKDFKF